MRHRFLKKALMLSYALAFFSEGMQGNAAELRLEEAIQRALQENTALRIQQKNEDIAEAQFRQAKGAKGFSVTISGSIDTAKAGSNVRTSSGALRLNGSLSLYSGGKKDANISVMELGIKNAILLTEREREELKYAVTKAYYDALEARQNVVISQESVDNYSAHLKNVEQLYGAGAKAKIDVLRSSVELSDAKQSLMKAQNAYEVNLSNLRDLINIERNEPLYLMDDFQYVEFHYPMQKCVDYAFMNRKDLFVDENIVQQKELAIKSARADYRPSVNLSIGTGVTENFEPISEVRSSYTAGISANWNLFDHGVTKAKVDEAILARDIAKMNLQRDEERIDLKVRQTYRNLREAEGRFTSTKEAVKQAEEDYYIVGEKYKAGEGVILDVIDAELARSRARKNQINAQYDYARYRAELEKEMGIGLTEQEALAADRMNVRLGSPVLQVPIAPAGARPTLDRKDIEKSSVSMGKIDERIGKTVAAELSGNANYDEDGGEGF